MDRMPDKAEKARRKGILRSQRDSMKRAKRDQFPIAATELRGLFDFLDKELPMNECNHTLRFTHEFIARRSLPEMRILNWLEQNGGYCDCEALNNAEQIVEEAVPGYGSGQDAV